MDSIKNFAEGTSNKPSNSTTQANAPTEDMLDKGLDSVERKFGEGKIDPQKMRSTNEKITDTAREQFEKFTGKNVPDKFSN